MELQEIYGHASSFRVAFTYEAFQGLGFRFPPFCSKLPQEVIGVLITPVLNPLEGHFL